VATLDAATIAGTPVNASTLRETSRKHVEDVIADWWELSDSLIVDWSDGFHKEDMPHEDTEYPKWWLKAVGYENGNPNPTPNLP
jgi:hypothetical protein